MLYPIPVSNSTAVQDESDWLISFESDDEEYLHNKEEKTI